MVFNLETHKCSNVSPVVADLGFANTRLRTHSNTCRFCACLLYTSSGKLESLESATSRKTMKTAENDNLDCAVYTWSVQQRSKGEPILGRIICEKALIINKKL